MIKSHHAGLNTSVSLNGSRAVPLSVASQSYLGQFNINLSYDNGSKEKYLSEFFNVDHSPSQPPMNWPAPSTSQVSLEPEQSTTAITIVSSSQTYSTTSSQLDSTPSSHLDSTPSSTTRASGLNGEAIAGISVGSIVGLSVLILTAILFMRRNRRNRRSQKSSSEMLKPVESAMPPTLSSSHFGAIEIAGISPATELAGKIEEGGELCAERAALRELPAAERGGTPIELSAHGIR